MTIREMTIDDYEEVFALWQITSKRALSKADEKSKNRILSDKKRGYEQGCRN